MYAFLICVSTHTSCMFIYLHVHQLYLSYTYKCTHRHASFIKTQHTYIIWTSLHMQTYMNFICVSYININIYCLLPPYVCRHTFTRWFFHMYAYISHVSFLSTQTCIPHVTFTGIQTIHVHVSLICIQTCELHMSLLCSYKVMCITCDFIVCTC